MDKKEVHAVAVQRDACRAISSATSKPIWYAN